MGGTVNRTNGRGDDDDAEVTVRVPPKKRKPESNLPSSPTTEIQAPAKKSKKSARSDIAASATPEHPSNSVTGESQRTMSVSPTDIPPHASATMTMTMTTQTALSDTRKDEPEPGSLAVLISSPPPTLPPAGMEHRDSHSTSSDVDNLTEPGMGQLKPCGS